MRMILLGPPGAGKGTQASALTEEYDLVHISTGDIFRENIRNKTPLGLKVTDYLSKGELVPDNLTIDLVWDRLDQEDVKDGFMLDGFPRTLKQAEALDQGLQERHQKLDVVLAIEVDSEILIRRLAGRRVCQECGATYHVDVNPTKVQGVCDVCGGAVIQRADDTESTVKERIEVYEAQTKPLIDYYRNQGLLQEVNGAQDVAAVTSEIHEKLSNL